MTGRLAKAKPSHNPSNYRFIFQRQLTWPPKWLLFFFSLSPPPHPLPCPPLISRAIKAVFIFLPIQFAFCLAPGPWGWGLKRLQYGRQNQSLLFILLNQARPAGLFRANLSPEGNKLAKSAAAHLFRIHTHTHKVHRTLRFITCCERPRECKGSRHNQNILGHWLKGSTRLPKPLTLHFQTPEMNFPFPLWNS